MNQLDILVDAPASRRTDPESSHRAERLVTQTGRRARDQIAVLKGFAAYPGFTTKELAEITGLDRYIVARRAPELYPFFLTRIEGRDGYRWTLTEAGQNVLRKIV